MDHPPAPGLPHAARRLLLPLLILLALTPPGAAGLRAAETGAAGPREVAAAVLGVRSEVPSEARTADTLGRQRVGTGVLIGADGLVLTIGYLILEAAAVDLYDADGRRVPATIVAYDHDSGLGLVRASEPLNARPLALGRSGTLAVGEPLLILSRDGDLDGRQARLASRREFAGYWEYLLPEALFTTPPHVAWAGAALIDREQRLVGIGSLLVGDAVAEEVTSPGNMFVPIDALRPILGDLLAQGRREGPAHPWLGLYAREHGGQLMVGSLAEDGPAALAGLRPGDVLLAVGGMQVRSLPELYRGIWQLGAPGVMVPLRVMRANRVIELDVPSIDRMRWLRLKQSY